MPKAKTTTTSSRSRTPKTPSGKSGVSSGAKKAPGKNASTTQKSRTPKNNSLTARVFYADKRESGSLSLPREVFGVRVNTTLLAQAVRVYRANLRQGTAQAKTRGEVHASTRKIWKQKGTGRARHGSVKAPIFVGGGVAHGPRARDYRLDLPSKMKKQAVLSALTSKFENGSMSIIDGLGTLEPKTGTFARILREAAGGNERDILLVCAESSESTKRATRNIPGVKTIEARNINAYEILSKKAIIVEKNAAEVIRKTFSVPV